MAEVKATKNNCNQQERTNMVLDTPNCVNDSSNSEKIVILVDDLVPMAKTTQKALERAGYRIETFFNPNEALTRIKTLSQSEAPRLDLLITDVMMPDMVGTELAKLVRTFFPKTKILFITASDNGLLQKYEAETGEKPQVIIKPYSLITAMVATVKEILSDKIPIETH